MWCKLSSSLTSSLTPWFSSFCRTLLRVVVHLCDALGPFWNVPIQRQGKGLSLLRRMKTLRRCCNDSFTYVRLSSRQRAPVSPLTNAQATEALTAKDHQQMTLLMHAAAAGSAAGFQAVVKAIDSVLSEDEVKGTAAVRLLLLSAVVVIFNVVPTVVCFVRTLAAAVFSRFPATNDIPTPCALLAAACCCSAPAASWLRWPRTWR